MQQDDIFNATTKFFEENGYLTLVDAISKDYAAELTHKMFEAEKNGLTTNDPQAPLSDALYDADFLRELQEKLRPNIGKHVGKELLSTYTYARIYRPGDELKPHKDRPACEISATLTLGYDNEPVWPIFFDEIKRRPVQLRVGDLAVYKGCEVEHWRQKFKGEWHVQVFVHYVDANGPYREEAVNEQKRKEAIRLTNSNNNVEQNNQQNQINFINPVHNAVLTPWADDTFPGAFSINSNNLPGLMLTKEDCDRLVNYTKKQYSHDASIGGDSKSTRIQKKIRSANVYPLDYCDEHAWIWNRCAEIATIVNQQWFKYDIAGITHSLQLLHYDSNDEVPGHYDWHIDAGPGNVNRRKISLTIQLSHESDYEGGELIIADHVGEQIGCKERGSVNLFPSYMPHKVSPVTKGERYALVIWIEGTRRFS